MCEGAVKYYYLTIYYSDKHYVVIKLSDPDDVINLIKHVNNAKRIKVVW